MAEYLIATGIFFTGVGILFMGLGVIGFFGTLSKALRGITSLSEAAGKINNALSGFKSDETPYSNSAYSRADVRRAVREATRDKRAS